jgi:hypothetical protein
VSSPGSRHTIFSEFDIWETELQLLQEFALFSIQSRWKRVGALEIEKEILKRKSGSR